jgi:Ca2+/Na+ antiporter
MVLFQGLQALFGWWPSVIILLLALCVVFVLLALVCDECLAPTLELLSERWGIPHDVACATFLALGSSAPEIAVSVISVFWGNKKSVDLGMGTISGSALIAFTVIPACCILVSPGRKLK